MAELGILQRRGFLWLMLLLAILAVIGVLWLVSSMIEGRAADLELDMDAGGSAAEVSARGRDGHAAPATYGASSIRNGAEA